MYDLNNINNVIYVSIGLLMVLHFLIPPSRDFITHFIKHAVSVNLDHIY